jgi:hypothetical protein
MKTETHVLCTEEALKGKVEAIVSKPGTVLTPEAAYGKDRRVDQLCRSNIFLSLPIYTQ